MDPKVLKVEESSVFAPPGGAAKVFRVVYVVGDHGPFTLDLKEAEFTPERVREGMAKTAATLRALS